MYVKRLLSKALKDALKYFNVVLITGARQAGKSTFLKNELSDYRYFSLDDIVLRNFLRKDPKGFINTLIEKKIIIDEIQYEPSFLSYIKIDVDSKTGRKWVLTGSQHFELMKGVQESLAGRIAILELSTFSLREHNYENLEDLFYFGLYPDVALDHGKRNIWVSSYVSTYLERDIRNLGIVRNLKAFEDFLFLIAAHHTQEFNASIISRQLGISVPTVKSWVSLLESTYIIYFVRPFYRNLGKRIVKSPKLYFADPILVSYLTRHTSKELTTSGPMYGAFFEGAVVMEFIKYFNSMGRKADIYFFRSNDGLEIDLLINVNGKLIPFEIKTTGTPTIRHIQNIERFKKLEPNLVSSKGYLICTVAKREALPFSNIAVPWSGIHDLLKELES